MKVLLRKSLMHAAPFFLVLLTIHPPETVLGGESEHTTLIYPPRSHALGHRATSNHLKLFLGKSAKFQDPRGIACVKLRQWDDPKTESDDDELFLVLVNRGRKEILFNNSMTSITKLSSNSKVNLTDPMGAAVDESGNVYVADPGAKRVMKLKLDDKGRLEFITSLTDGPGEGETLLEPVGVCTAIDGRVFVADRSRNRIYVYGSNGEFLRCFDGGKVGENGILQPLDVSVLSENDPWNFFHSAGLYVLDMDGKRIQKLSVDGERDAVFYAWDLGLTGASFSSIAVDYYSQLFVTDRKNHCIHKFDRKLNYLTTYGTRGTGDGQFISPAGITIWKRFGQVFVADSVSVQYFWIGTDILRQDDKDGNGATIRKDERGRPTILVNFDITEPSEISLQLDRKKGKNIQLFKWRRYFPKSLHLALPLETTDDVDLESDDLKLVIRARPTYSSKESFEKKVIFPVSVSH